MKKALLAIILVCVVAGFFVGRRVVNSAVSQTVDQRVAEHVAEKSRTLPERIAEGIRLQKIEHQEGSKEITFVYRVTINIPNNQLGAIESQANSRILADENLSRALDNQVRVFNRFEKNSGQILLEFETLR